MDGREPKMSGTLNDRFGQKKNRSPHVPTKKIQFKLNFILKLLMYFLLATSVGGGVIYITMKRSAFNSLYDLNPLMLGFKCESIKIEGLKYAKLEDVKAAIPIKLGSSMFVESPEHIRENIETLSWIRTAMVRRVLPNTLHIRVVEYQPMAYWQVSNKLFLIDNHGVIIQGEMHRNLSHLPVITGDKAAEKFPQLMREISLFPEIYNRITGAVFISQRRWDIILDGKLKIKLPEQNVKSAIQYFHALEEDHALAHKDVSSVDLRVPDRVYFTLSENAKMMKFYSSKNKQA